MNGKIQFLKSTVIGGVVFPVPLDLPLTEAIGHFEGFGKGSNELLRGRL